MGEPPTPTRMPPSHAAAAPRRSTARTLLLLPREPVAMDLVPTAALAPDQVESVWGLYSR